MVTVKLFASLRNRSIAILAIANELILVVCEGYFRIVDTFKDQRNVVREVLNHLFQIHFLRVQLERLIRIGYKGNNT